MRIMQTIDVPIVFIVGSSRSGTTMFNRILGNHPDILALNELHYIGRTWEMNGSHLWQRERAMGEAAILLATARRSLWDEKPTAAEFELARSLVSEERDDGFAPGEVFSLVLKYLLREAGKKLATDQTPRNILYVNEILAYFPNAKVIQLIRDPRAVMFSQKNRWRQRSLGAKGTPLWNAIRVFFNYHPYTVSNLWEAAYLKGAAVAGHRNYLAIRFEDLVANPAIELRRACDFLGITFVQGMLNVPRVGSSNLQHREELRGISSEVLDAWRGKLAAAELWLCEWKTKDSMRKLGYAPEVIGVPWLGLLWQLLVYPFHVIGVLLINPRLAIKVAKALRRGAND